ncbi:MAG: hypothetical protein NTY01_15195 [Verrucomicrobia bacterium]|nr:hypothetical protein [Verrucomicrobiota bacterium]
MACGNFIRVLMASVLGALFAFAAFEPVVAHCTDDDDDGAMCYCLCTQALDAPEAVPTVGSPILTVAALSPEPDGFISLSFRPPTPPPRA